MRSRRGGGIPLVLIKISKEFKNIYHLKEMFGLEITVESLRSRPGVGQCYRCQLFGHGQARCTAPAVAAWPVAARTPLESAQDREISRRPALIAGMSTPRTIGVAFDAPRPERCRSGDRQSIVKYPRLM